MPLLRPTTLLAHHAPGGFHYDWLIDPPPPSEFRDAAELPLLWTARVGLLWDAWPAAGVLQAHALPPHRRRYLAWSGELSGGRGRVAVAARGHLDVARWGDTHIEATLHADPLVLGLILSRPAPDAADWRVAVEQLPGSHPRACAIS